MIMRKFSKKQYLAAGAAAALIAGGAGIAYAYWTTTGSGSGSGTNASSNGTLVLHSIVTPGLTPGGSVNVSYTADNSNSSSAFVATLTVGTLSVDAAHSTCVIGDFHASATPNSGGTQVAANSTGTVVGSGTLTMDDTTANQDACKGAVITIPVTST